MKIGLNEKRGMVGVVPGVGLIGLMWVAYASLRIRSWRPVRRAMALAFASGALAGGLAFPIVFGRFRRTSTDMGYPSWEFLVMFFVLIYVLFGMTFGIGLSMILRATWLKNEDSRATDLIWIYRVSRVVGSVLMVVACAGCALVFLV